MTMQEIAGPSSLSESDLRLFREKNDFQKTEELIKHYRQSTGFLVDRRISQEEIKERQDWVEAKRSRSNLSIRDRNYDVRKVSFPDTLYGLYCAKFSDDGNVIVTSFGSGCIQLRNGETCELQATIRNGLDTSLPVTFCCFHPIHKEILYAASACGTIFRSRVDELHFWKFTHEPGNEINTIDVDFTGEHIVSGGKDAGLRIYDSETAKLVKSYKKDKLNLISEDVIKYHHARIFAVKWHKTDPNIIITGGWDDAVKIWDTRIGDGSVRSILGPHVCGDAIDLRDTKILTGSWAVRDSLQLWDMTSGNLIETIDPANRLPTLSGEYLYSAHYFDGDPYGDLVVVGGSGTGKVELISLKEKSVVASFSANKAVIAIDSYRNGIVYGGMDSIITIADYS